jgi:lysophospholipase L1-like esterase
MQIMYTCPQASLLTRIPLPRRRHLALAALCLAFTLPAASAQNTGVFTCATRAAKSAHALTGETRFTGGQTYGWDLQATPTTFTGGACSSTQPFLFSLAEGDGNYQVTVELGGPAASTITVKAEARRLIVLQAAIPAGGKKTVVFNVNVRTPEIPGGDKVKLKDREIGALDWDNKLTLEFNGDHPSVRSIAIKPVDVPTIYLAGDSTVVDQDKEPWAAWGQMLPAFFNQEIAVANHAESGETIKGFLGESRFDKIFSTFKKGDFLFLQFAHNDQKPGPSFSSIDEYKKEVRDLETQVKARGGTVILVSSMNRRAFDENGKIKQTLGGYPQAMRDVAAEDHIELVDLNAMSKTLYEAMGPAGTLKAFVHYPANTFPDQPQELKDDTHFNAYGAYELARCVVQSLRDQKSPLTKYLVPGIPAFDPAHPDPVESFHLPASPFYSTLKPYGN